MSDPSQNSRRRASSGATVLAGVMAALFAGCAKLDVRVSVLDKSVYQTTYWRSAEIGKRLVDKKALLTPAKPGETDAFAKQESKAASIDAEWKNLMSALDASVGTTNAELGYLHNGGTAFEPLVDEIHEAFKAARDDYAKAIKRGDAAEPLGISDLRRKRDAGFAALHDAEELMNEGDQKLADIRDTVSRKFENDPQVKMFWNISRALGAQTRFRKKVTVLNVPATRPSTEASTEPSEVVVADPSAIKNARRKVQEVKAAPYDSIIGDNGLFNDDQASLVVNAPREYWRGIFNESSGSGQMGNTDIAIKMQTMGDFSVKGVRVDASKVTQATFAGIGQAIKLVAVASGVPVVGGFPKFPAAADETKDTTAGNGDDVGGTLLTADASRRKIEIADKQRHEAALQMLRAISAEADVLEAKPAVAADVLKASITRVKSAFDNNADDLQTPNPTTQADPN